MRIGDKCLYCKKSLKGEHYNKKYCDNKCKVGYYRNDKNRRILKDINGKSIQQQNSNYDMNLNVPNMHKMKSIFK